MRQKRPDKKEALSLLVAAKRDMDFTLSLDISEASGPTIARNTYECFRKLGDAILIAKGIESEDHVRPIKELINLKVNTTRPLGTIDNLRRLRHNINYYGYLPKLAEVQDAVSIAKACFYPIVKKLEEEFNNA